MIAKLSTGRLTNNRGPSSKPWYQYTRQQQYNKRKGLVNSIQCALTFCEEGFKAFKLSMHLKSLTWLQVHVSPTDA